jgi:8-hydroxy-5-deazaflavin:NADPH oxidoreductase
MKVAIVGTGHIGGTLGKKWSRAGQQAYYGVRNPQKPEVQALVKSLGATASASSISDAIGWGEIVVFAVPGGGMKETITAHARALDGKMIIEATNNMDAPSMNNQATLASQTPRAKTFRAFNNYGWDIFENPTYRDVAADLFYCGPDGHERSTVEKLVSDVGLNPVFVGGPEAVDIVDSVLKVWFTLVSGRKMGRNIAFKLLTR